MCGRRGHFSHLWNCWTLSTTPPSISCIFFSEWDPPIILGPEFWLQTTKGNIAIHKIQRIPSRANLHLIILKREPHAYAGPTVSTFFQYRKSPPIIFSSKLHIFCYKRFCPRGTLNGISFRVLLPKKWPCCMHSLRESLCQRACSSWYWSWLDLHQDFRTTSNKEILI